METEIKKLFDENFDFAFKAATYNNMRVAVQTFEQFKQKNQDFFSFDKRETLFGYLRTYAIEKQFNDSAFNPKANYSETNDFIVNVGRTDNEHKLLPASSYKREYAKANAGLSTQLSFEFFNDEPKIVESKKYAEITYGYSYGDMTHLCIVLPSGDYKTIEHSINLLDDIKIYENYVPEDLVEESIVSLKKSLSREIEKII